MVVIGAGIVKELKQPVKSKSVRVRKRSKDRPNAPTYSGPLKRGLKGLMTNKFQLRDLVYNRDTREDGLIRRVYERNGAATYEVAVPLMKDSWARGYCISDWSEDVLQLSNNELLEASPLEGGIRF